jgi:integrase
MFTEMEIIMSTTQPIRDAKELEAFRNFYKDRESNPRNYALIVLGINCALRISDLLKLQWNMVYNFKKKCFRKHMTVCESKTGKMTIIALNDNAILALNAYMQSLKSIQPGQYIFYGRDMRSSLSRSQAFRIIKHAATVLGIGDDISCHSLRKTFGYYAWKNGTPPAMLMDIYNHSSYEITKRYLGIKQDDKDSVFLGLNL